jgi:hypothetical protein
LLPGRFAARRLAPRDPDRRDDATDERRQDDGERDVVGHVVVAHEQHLHADESQDQHQAVLQVAEQRHEARHGEVERSQPEDREGVGREDQERVARDREDRRDGVDREHHVGELDHHQRHEERRGVELGVPAHEEVGLVHFVGDRDEPPHEPGRKTVLDVWRVLAVAQHPERRDDQDRAEHVEHPVEVVQQRRAGRDHHAAQHDRADDAPEQHAVLELRRDLQVTEDHRDHENVVDRQRPLEHVAGDELQHRIPPEVAAVAHPGPRGKPQPAVLVQAIDHDREGHRDADPDSCPEQRLLDRERGRLAVQHAQVEDQQPKEEREEPRPDEFDHAGLPSAVRAGSAGCPLRAARRPRRSLS